MIIQTRNGMANTAVEPVILLMTDEEKKGFMSMKDGENIICVYPENMGFTPELIRDWALQSFTIKG